MTKEEEIRRLLSQGHSRAELIRRGYSRGSVYKVGRQLKIEGVQRPAASNGSSAESRPAAPASPMAPSGDPEISQLQKEIQRARLEAELDRVRGETKTVEELEREVARLREWTVAMVRSLGEAIEQLAGNTVDAAAFEAFEREALQELRGSTRKN